VRTGDTQMTRKPETWFMGACIVWTGVNGRRLPLILFYRREYRQGSLQMSFHMAHVVIQTVHVCLLLIDVTGFEKFLFRRSSWARTPQLLCSHNWDLEPSKLSVRKAESSVSFLRLAHPVSKTPITGGRRSRPPTQSSYHLRFPSHLRERRDCPA
jgi:hypothetical protein